MLRNGFMQNLPLWQDAEREISLFWTFPAWHVWVSSGNFKTGYCIQLWICPVLFSSYGDLKLFHPVLNSPTQLFSYIILYWWLNQPSLKFALRSEGQKDKINMKHGQNFSCICSMYKLSLSFFHWQDHGTFGFGPLCVVPLTTELGTSGHVTLSVDMIGKHRISCFNEEILCNKNLNHFKNCMYHTLNNLRL